MSDRLALLQFLLATGAVLGNGWLLSRRLFPARGALHATQTVLLACAQAVTLLTVLGLFGWLHPVPVLALPVAAFLWLLRRTGRQSAAPVAPAADTGTPLALQGLASATVWMMALALPWSFWFMLAYPHPITDTLTYHLPRPIEWARMGAFPPVEADFFRQHVHAYYPFNGEILFLWNLLWTRNDILVRPIQPFFMAMSCVALYAILELLPLSRPLRLLAAAMLPVFPASAYAAFTAKNDVILTFFFLCGVLFLLRMPRDGERGGSLFWISIGLLLGTKLLGAPYAAALLLLGFLRHGAVGGHELARAAGWVTLLGGYAYLRNALATGNPFWPAQMQIGQTVLLAGRHPHLLAVGATGGPILLVAAGALLLVLLRMRRLGRERLQRTVPVLLFLIPAAYLLVRISVPWQESRYFLPVLALCVPIAAHVAQAALRTPYATTPLATLLLIACAVGATGHPRCVAWGLPLGAGLWTAGRLLSALCARYGLRIRWPLTAALFVGLVFLFALWPIAVQFNRRWAIPYLAGAYRPRGGAGAEGATGRGGYSEAWMQLEHLTRRTGGTVLVCGDEILYPLYGGGWQNRLRVLQVPPGGARDGIDAGLRTRLREEILRETPDYVWVRGARDPAALAAQIVPPDRAVVREIWQFGPTCLIALDPNPAGGP
ncbi:MAG: hypothetical protein HY608_07155 [Planctomycetes bacterium]|nr:hypothetical protein [Planctomycetota bacterium]